MKTFIDTQLGFEADKYIYDTLSARIKELMQDPTFKAEALRICKSASEVKQYAFDTALYTLMFSVEEREAHVNNNN